MKKLLIVILLLCVAAAVFFFLRSRNNVRDISGLFDPTPPEVSGSENEPADDTPAQAVTNPIPENNSEPLITEPETTPDDENNSEVSSDTAEEPPAPFSHTESEKQTIISRYIEAQSFYYTMLYQHFELDSYDVISRKNSDGYETHYHRVLYYGVNSKADLIECYREYFTDDFIATVDFSSYIEESDKLYCAETVNNSSGNISHGHTVESVDENNAFVIVSGTSKKIKAVKVNETWYFSSVAII